MFNKTRIMQFLRFCTVGLGNTAVDFTMFFILTWCGLPYLLAQVFSYSAGIVNSFFFNRQWTFRIKGQIRVGEAVRFIMVNGFSIIVSSGTIYILQDIYHGDLWLSKLIATGFALTVNFIGSRLWVFGHKPIAENGI